jgi:hypothetical protein
MRSKKKEPPESEFITSLDQVTPAWVPGVLEQAGLLHVATVAAGQ